MTTVQQIQQEICALDEELLEELLDFARFLKQKKSVRSASLQRKLKPEVIQAIKESEAEWERGEVQVFDDAEHAVAFLDSLSDVA